MKKIKLLGWLLVFIPFHSIAQEFKEHITKEFNTRSALAVYNISGSVKVTGYAGNKVVIDVDKTISAKNTEELEKGKKEFRLEMEERGDTIWAYIAEPQDSRPGNHNDWNERERIRYWYHLDFVIKVPVGMNLRLSTVNDGDIRISDVTGILDISNVNGSIKISGARGTTDAHTVNGDVEVSYVSVPDDASSYTTINGNVTATYPSTLSADLAFKSLNGNFYTDFNEVEILPAKVIKRDKTTGGGTVYKMDKNSNFRFGKGGKQMKFETLNGNVYVKKQS